MPKCGRAQWPSIKMPSMHGTIGAHGTCHGNLRARAGVMMDKMPGAVFKYKKIGGQQVALRQKFIARHQGTLMMQNGMRVPAAYLGRIRVGKDSGPTLDDGGAPDQRRPSRMYATYCRLIRPDLFHSRYVARGEGRVEGLVGLQDRLFIAHRISSPLLGPAYETP